MNRKNKKITSYFILFSLILILGVVYAILQANLQINGTAKIAQNTWNVHFDNIIVNPDSVSIGTGDTAAIIDPNNNCKVDFEVTLSLPGDFYEFTVDVENEGSIDAMVGFLDKSFKINNVESVVPDYLNYTVTYDDGGEILEKHLIAKNTSEKYKVRVEFKTDIDAEDLPEATTLSITVEPTYVQADDTAIKKPPFYACTYDGELVQGAEYVNGQYTYRYKQQFSFNGVEDLTDDGWGVTLTDKNSTDPVTSRLCTTINNKPVVSMKTMFRSSKTTSIDTSSFNTTYVTNMSSMFHSCSNLTTVDVTNFDTSNVTDMTGMFCLCSALTSVDVTNFNTSNVIDMRDMFDGCSSLIELDLSGFDLRKLPSFYEGAGGIFADTSSLKKINMSNWKLPADMRNVFTSGALRSSPIEEIDVTGWDLSNTTNAFHMFGSAGSDGKGGSGLLRIKGLDTWDTSHITIMADMFYGLSSLTSLDLSNFETSNVTDMYNMFGYCSSLTELNLSGFDLSKGSSFNSIANAIFQSTTSLKKINMSNWKLPVDMSDAIFRYGNAKSSPIEEIDVTGWDLSQTTNLSGVFASLGSNGKGGTGLLRIKGLNTWDTSHITNMSNMFLGLSSMTSLNLSGFNTSNVTTLESMFNGCRSLTTLDLSGLDFSTSNPDALMMYLSGGGFVSLTTLNMSNVILPSSCNYAFGGLVTVETIIFDNVDASNVTDMQAMFYGCSNLKTLDLSSFTIGSSMNLGNAFYGCSSITTAYARTQTDADRLNASNNKPTTFTFVVKP